MQTPKITTAASTPQPYRLQHGAIQLTIDPVFGTLLSIRDAKRDIELIGEQRLAENFRLLVPLPDWRGHYIIGCEQKLAECHLSEAEAELIWRDLHSKRGAFSIEFRLKISIQDNAVLFHASLTNHSDFPVEEVWAPALGGMANEAEADVLWMSRIIDPVPHVEVEADPKVKFTLHESRTEPGTCALVLNHFSKEPLAARLRWKNPLPAMLHSILQPPIAVRLDEEIQIPAGDCAVVVVRDPTGTPKPS